MPNERDHREHCVKFWKVQGTHTSAIAWPRCVSLELEQNEFDFWIWFLFNFYSSTLTCSFFFHHAMLWLAIANLISQSYAIFLNKKLSFGSLASFLQIKLPRNLLEEKFLRVSYYIRIFAFLRNVTGKCLYNTTISRINRVSLVVSSGFRAQATRVSYKLVSYKKTCIPGYSGLFQVIPGYSRLFQVIPGYSRLSQVIPAYSRLFRVLLHPEILCC